MSDREQLRSDLAAERGLGPEAAHLLSGSTVEELEASAHALATLLGDHGREPEPVPAPGPFGDMAAAKAQRKAELAALFTGRAPQPRDPEGRYAAKPSGSFDGGARRPIAAAPVGHDEWLAGVIGRRSNDVGAWL